MNGVNVRISPMDFRSIARPVDAFQQALTAEQIEAVCRRGFGLDVSVVSAVEQSGGMYNSTYRVDIAGHRPVILRVAPEPARQYRIERCLMRNEYASVPFLAPIAPMMPRTLAVDFTHDLIGRDYLFQTMLEGIPAPEGIGGYPRAQWASLFRQMGDIARTIHAVLGERFGPVIGPLYDTWSEALVSYFVDLACDLDDAGLEATDLREIAAAAAKHATVLDEVTTPHLLHGDLWTVNVMIEPGAVEPTISGVFDNDRTWWGDPESDWTIFMAAKNPGTEHDAFWETYGPRPSTLAAARRSLFYRAKHIGAIRLERHRLGNTAAVPETYDQMRAVLDQLDV
jgi:aminoglycoside phosphotransferase (APT) family kinase protein